MDESSSVKNYYVQNYLYNDTTSFIVVPIMTVEQGRSSKIISYDATYLLPFYGLKCKILVILAQPVTVEWLSVVK